MAIQALRFTGKIGVIASEEEDMPVEVADDAGLPEYDTQAMLSANSLSLMTMISASSLSLITMASASRRLPDSSATLPRLFPV